MQFAAERPNNGRHLSYPSAGPDENGQWTTLFEYGVMTSTLHSLATPTSGNLNGNFVWMWSTLPRRQKITHVVVTKGLNFKDVQVRVDLGALGNGLPTEYTTNGIDCGTYTENDPDEEFAVFTCPDGTEANTVLIQNGDTTEKLGVGMIRVFSGDC